MKWPFIFLLFISGICQSQLHLKKLDKQSIPFRYKGQIVTAVTWTDKFGEHYVVTAETGKYTNAQGNRNALLYAYHYLKNKQTWRVQDGVTDCPVDLKAKFIKDAFAVTDLDNNGIAEIWLMYNVTCRGDVGPSEMKIIMYEGDKKHAMRGETKVSLSEKEVYGNGKYAFDDAFKKAPAVFRAYAQKLWAKNIMETFGI